MISPFKSLGVRHSNCAQKTGLHIACDHYYIICMLMVMLLGLPACGEKEVTRESMIKSQISGISASRWDNISKKYIFFGHQSVGRNILDGIASVLNEHSDINLRVEELKDKAPSGPALLHRRVGKNTQPSTKINEFEKVVSEYGSIFDYAGLKFCYVDINQDTDVKALFDEYQSSVERLKNKFPHIKIIHFTVPLEATSWDIISKVKSVVKTIIGKPDANYRRYEYNQLIRRAYENNELLFDLARIEATFPDGRISTHIKDGFRYETLVPAYTHDGGHLNELGQKIVAESILMFMLNVAD